MNESITIDINSIPAGMSTTEVLKYYNTTGMLFASHKPTNEVVWKPIEIKQEGTFLENIQNDI